MVASAKGYVNVVKLLINYESVEEPNLDPVGVCYYPRRGVISFVLAIFFVTDTRFLCSRGMIDSRN